jgi:hypothetical protein
MTVLDLFSYPSIKAEPDDPARMIPKFTPARSRRNGSVGIGRRPEPLSGVKG